MKKIILPAAIVLIVAAVALSMGTFTSDSQSTLISDGTKDCSRTAVIASGSECGDKATKTAASNKQCGDKTRATMVSERKECGPVSTATKASDVIECPHSGAVLNAADETKSCGEKATGVHASAEKADTEEACCEKHAFASAE